MVDPFANIRRRPATATYGRKALAARRIAMPTTSATAGEPGRNAGRSPISLPATSTGSIDVFSNSSESDTSTDEAGPRLGVKTKDTSDRPWARRTAHSAISKLESLYEETKAMASIESPDNTMPSTSREVLESTKDKWDLGNVSSGFSHSLKSADKPSKKTVASNGKVIKKAKSAPIRRVRNSKNDIATTGANNVSSTTTSRSRSRSRSEINTNNTKSGPKSFRKDIPSPVSSSNENISAFGMSELLSSSPIFSRAKKSKRQPKAKRARGATTLCDEKVDLPSSSPPSTPGRLLDSGKGSRLSSSRAGSEGSDSDYERGHATAALGSSTPTSQIGSRTVLESMQGPSSATSKRMQMRAFSHNVVYTYGRSRDDDDLNSEFSPTLRLPTIFETNNQRTLEESKQSDSNYDNGTATLTNYCKSNQSLRQQIFEKGSSALSAASHLLDLVDDPAGLGTSGHSSSNETDKTVSAGPFKQQLSDIIHGLSASNNRAEGTTTASACLKLISKLDEHEFCEELFSNKQWLTTLVQSLHRVRDDPTVFATTMTLVAIAFNVPTTMQVLIFEKQVLEIVAGILKSVNTSALPDILLLRQPGEFDSPEQHRCVEQICKLAHEHGLLDDESLLPLSTCSLALSALHGFTRNDDVAFVAMAGLLRNEMHESGCLGLIAERFLTWSIPMFIEKQSQSPDAPGSLRNINACGKLQSTFSGQIHKNDECDDMWMNFDLPEEPKQVPRSLSETRSKSTNSKPKNKLATTTTTADSNCNKQRMEKLSTYSLAREPDGTEPTFATITLELEILRFCIAASVDNQHELLSTDSCVSKLLVLLSTCQMAGSKVRGLALIQNLETVTMTLQLMVNLSNSSTVFCAQFFENEGLAVVAKSIALMSQNMAPAASSIKPIHRDPGTSTHRRTAQITEEINNLRYDVLLISSALLTNIVESDSSSVVYFGHVYQSPQCPLLDKCFPECVCASKLPFVVLITKAFLACHSAEATSVDAMIAAGYLAVLLGFLMREPGVNRQVILKHLPGGNTSILLRHIEKFVQVSSTVNQKVASGLLDSLGSALTGRADQQQEQRHSMQQLPGIFEKHQTLHKLLTGNTGVTGDQCNNNEYLGAMHSKTSASSSLQSVIDTLGKI
ncbi:hypothetical protein GGI26_003766 [Coemansia sp. RSA 1358]|uniref:Wings apart-like protein C-terminal domain-containing protein n=1 Tax=Coemansia umbellata TaxID=1424467 RepID=A0ABQ8PN53_9FUNG|nr:hypothetical protein EDC05_002774 [Coemansia umbellata]KAJ2621786.1 hypothetical protein GGI26_003766 [Coemansia sp. RSA 1358]